MKKTFIVFTLFILLLCGCGGKPSTISDEAYTTAEYAIKVSDMYLDGISTKEEASEKIYALNTDGFYPDDNHKDNYKIVASIIGLTTAFLTEDMGEIKSNRDELADVINYKD